jgi:hypothetical protein
MAAVQTTAQQSKEFRKEKDTKNYALKLEVSGGNTLNSLTVTEKGSMGGIVTISLELKPNVGSVTFTTKTHFIDPWDTIKLKKAVEESLCISSDRVVGRFSGGEDRFLDRMLDLIDFSIASISRLDLDNLSDDEVVRNARAVRVLQKAKDEIKLGERLVVLSSHLRKVEEQAK